mgnify:CR=1 FL=1|jgi:hypothetical protein
MIKLLDILKEDNHVITFDKKSDEKFYRKVLNYVVENLGKRIVDNIQFYVHCKEPYCLPLTQTVSYKKISDFLTEELQLKRVEKDEIFLLLIFNIGIQDFLTEPLDLGENYKLYHVRHTEQAIETNENWSRDDCQMCDGDGELKYECGNCDGEGTVNYQDYDTPQECQDCTGDGYTMVKCEDCQDGTVENETRDYRLDYLISSFLTEKELIIPDGEFTFDHFIKSNKNNDIINYKEKVNGYKLETWKEDLEQPGMVQSIDGFPDFDIHDLDLLSAKGITRIR